MNRNESTTEVGYVDSSGKEIKGEDALYLYLGTKRQFCQGKPDWGLTFLESGPNI